MNVQPLLTPKVSASFLAFEGVVWIGLERKWKKFKYYQVFTTTIRVTMMINVLFII